jgi:hypothetical protein
MPLMAVWYEALPVTMVDGRLPKVVVSLETAEEPDAVPEIGATDGDPLLRETLELLPPAIVVPGSVVVGPGT